ncbi:hypothetical protein ACFSUE_22395 [Sporolactobacillus shoreicorticis]|uniref:Transcriptional regulator n=3 Tax=Sporolactobacillus shoreicorticis TaxID=1923877 RepID=A0ABW5S9I1_9BACL
MDSDKVTRLFNLCVKAETDFRNENRPKLARKAAKLQHKLYWITVNELRKEDEKGSAQLTGMERKCFLIIKHALTGKLGMTIDELHHVVDLFHIKRSEIRKPLTSAKAGDLEFKVFNQQSTDAIIAQ